MKRILISIVLIIALMIGVNGCMRIGKPSIEDKMVAYMNEKYPDDVFAYKGPFGGGAGAKSKIIKVSSEKYPDNDIYVTCDKNDDNTYKYRDNYIGVKYSNQTEALIKNIVTTVFGSDFFLEYEIDMYGHPKNDSADTTFEEYISDPSSDIGFMAVIGDSYQMKNKDAIVEQLEKSFVDNGFCCYVGTIYFDNSTEEYRTLTGGMEFSAYLYKKLYKEALTFRMKTADEFYKYEWKE